jgi:spore coat polysaccharide biosynthesis protein SpsF
LQFGWICAVSGKIKTDKMNDLAGNLVIISQARMTSTRLPGKVAIDVLGKSLLEHHLERLQRVELKTRVVVATTVNEQDDKIVDICEALDVDVYRGSEHDVLARYFHAARKFEADIVVRVTSDCPLIDPAIIDKTISRFLALQPDIDYVSNCRLNQTYPRGLDTEVFGFSSLSAAHTNANLAFEREHVTPFIWQRPDEFRLDNVDHDSDLSDKRWTVDTQEDLELIKLLLTACYQNNRTFGLSECLEQLQKNPEWDYINKHIEQKKIS